MQDIQLDTCRYDKTCNNKTKGCKLMNSTAKVLVPDKEWLVTSDNNKKIGAITKNKKGYVFYKNGQSLGFKNLTDIKAQLGIELFEEGFKKVKKDIDNKNYYIYDFPCRTKPYEPVYSVKSKLPLFAKSPKSKSRYCAGYYVILRGKGWATSFCPKLITVQRYPYHGPFKTEQEMKTMLNNLNKV